MLEQWMVWAQESIHACLQVWVEYDRPAEGSPK